MSGKGSRIVAGVGPTGPGKWAVVRERAVVRETSKEVPVPHSGPDLTLGESDESEQENYDDDGRFVGHFLSV